MKHLYISIGTLILSLTFLYYADLLQAKSMMSNQCNKNCGSVTNCEMGADHLQSGWTHCDILPSGCHVHGSFCSGGDPGNLPEEK